MTRTVNRVAPYFLPDECRVPIFDDVGEILRYNRFHVKFYVRQIKGENQENV